jgi:hypothetical protein
MDGKQWNFEFETYFKDEFLQSTSDTPPLSNGVDMMPNAKWPHHINFDNPKSNDLVNLSNLGSTPLCITSDNQLLVKNVWLPIIHHYLCQCQI